MVERGSFAIDSIAGEVFSGFSEGDDWNGWARPYFEREEAERVLRLSEANGFRWRYDPGQDAFIVRHKRDSTGDAPEIYGGRTITLDSRTVTVYPVGAGVWIWEMAEDDWTSEDS